jgi:hypothetical protein
VLYRAQDCFTGEDLQGILAELKIVLQVQRATGIDELKGVLQVKISRASTPSSRLFYR